MTGWTNTKECGELDQKYPREAASIALKLDFGVVFFTHPLTHQVNFDTGRKNAYLSKIGILQINAPRNHSHLMRVFARVWPSLAHITNCVLV